MILKKIKRILAFTLFLAMLLSILPPVALAADEETRWNPIELTDITSNDTIAITMSKGDVTYALPTIAEGNNGQPLAKSATIDNGQLVTSGDGSHFGWTITPADGGYNIMTNGNYLYSINNNNGMRIGNTTAVWTIDKAYLSTKDSGANVRYLGVYNSTDWRAYKLSSNQIATNIKDQILQFWILDNSTTEPTDPTTPICEHDWDEGISTATCTDAGVITYTCTLCGEIKEEPIEALGHSFTDGVCDRCGYSDVEPDAPVGGYVLVKAGETLAVGDTIVIVCGSKFVEMSGFPNTNYANGAAYTDVPVGVYPLIVLPGESEGTYSFETPVGKYLSGPSNAGSNYLVLSDSIGTLSSWTVTIDADGNADICVDCSGTARYIRWNAGNPRFSTYKSGQTAVQIYKHVIIDPTVCIHESKTVTGHKDPSCVEDGYDEWTCNTCGETGTDVLPPSDDYHIPGETEVIVLSPPSCYEEGLQEIMVRCTVCSGILSYTTEPIPTIPHTYGEDDRCTVCTKYKAGKTFYLTNDPLSATYFVIYHPASGTALSLDASGEKLMPSQVTVENGVLTTVENTAVFIRIASENEAFPMSMATHEWSYLTSGETGNALFFAPKANEYSHWNPVLVSEADSTFQFMNAAAAYNGNKNQAIEFYKDLFTVYGVADTDAYAFQIYCDIKPACVHQWDDGEVTLEATCYSEGTLLRTCALCQEVTEEPIPTLDHAWEATEVTPPTCYEAGYTTYTCSLCGDCYDDDFIDPTGHTWLEATCTSPSVCSVCGEEGGIFLPITKASHIFDGSRIVIAVRVGDEYVALGHTVESNGKIKPTAVSAYPSHLNTYNDSISWSVAQTEGGFALESDLGYLAHAGAKETGFKYSEEAFTWDLRSDESGFHLYSTLADRAIMYQSSGNVFGVYANSNLTNSNYSGDLVIYRYYPGRSLPHWDEDSDKYCDGCGTYISDASLVSRSISLNGNIAVNFYMSISDKVLNGEKSPYMIFTQEDKDPVNVPLAQSHKVIVNGTPTYVFTYEVAAKEMADTITAQLFYGDSCTEKYTYSVKTYADNMRTQLAEDDPCMLLLDAMLHYGAASQIQFNYHTDRPANDGVASVDFSAVKIEGFPTVLPQGTDLVSFAGATLLLESETTLRFFLHANAAVESFTVTYNGQPLEIKTRNGLYYVDVENISAPNLDNNFTITVDDGTASADITYSPMSYCSSIRTNYNTEQHEALLNVCAALYLYNQAANEYFGLYE